MRPFSLLVKPASADCNLNCEYCFYLEKCSLFPESRRHRMSDAVLERMVRTYLATAQPVYSFGWQGGEPTLMGQAFFERVVALQQQHGRAGASVSNGLQTNGTLLDPAFTDFLARYRFLVGCSLDGPPAIHDRYRHSRGGRGSHAAVMRGIRNMRASGVEFNILVLVSQANVRRAREVYRYLVDQDFLYHQYIPCVEFNPAGDRMPFAISGPEWGEFLCELFDAWAADDTRRVSIRHFDSVLSKIVDAQDTVCCMSENCCQYFVVEHNGNVYPCDFFVEPHLKLGNVMTDEWESLQRSPVYAEFGRRKCRWHPDCGDCEYLQLCNGDCIKHRNPAFHGPENLSVLCGGWKQFYAHTMDRFAALGQSIRDERRRAAQTFELAGVSAGSGPVGRNDPCPCGSGRKYKRCCGAS